MTLFRQLPRLTLTALLFVGSGCAGGTPDAVESTSPGPPATYDNYVSLGDSYSSAPGVPPMAPGMCMRSLANYASQVAKKLGIPLDDRTCSAAAISDLTTPQAAGVPPQFGGLTRATDLVTLSIGANPSLSTAWFFGCVAVAPKDPQGSPCKDAMQSAGGDRLYDAIETSKAGLTASVAEIHRRSPDARVVLVGYPQIFPRTGWCPERLPVTAADLVYADKVLRSLNATIEAVAKAGNADYVDVYAATRGHDICASDPWIQGKDSESGVALFYHPRAAEQKAVADLLVNLLH
jgi:hypothetical protein